MQPYTDIITNKDTIDRTTHVFAPSKPEKLKTYRMVFNTISVEKMNAILFDYLLLFVVQRVVLQPTTDNRRRKL